MLARSLARASFFGLAVLISACSSDDEPANEPDDSSIEDVVYVAGTDEAVEHLLDRTPKDVASQRLVIESPEDGATLSAGAPPTISYRYAADGKLLLDRQQGRYVRPSWTERALTDLRNLFGPERLAHAHGTPFTGVGYFLELEDADGNHVLRVFTDQTSYTPESATWLGLAAVSQPLTLTIVSAAFEENEIPASGGPFVGASIELRVE
jgi:hypothetical protein